MAEELWGQGVGVQAGDKKYSWWALGHLYPTSQLPKADCPECPMPPVLPPERDVFMHVSTNFYYV